MRLVCGVARSQQARGRLRAIPWFCCGWRVHFVGAKFARRSRHARPRSSASIATAEDIRPPSAPGWFGVGWAWRVNEHAAAALTSILVAAGRGIGGPPQTSAPRGDYVTIAAEADRVMRGATAGRVFDRGPAWHEFEFAASAAPAQA